MTYNFWHIDVLIICHNVLDQNHVYCSKVMAGNFSAWFGLIASNDSYFCHVDSKSGNIDVSENSPFVAFSGSLNDVFRIYLWI